MSVEIFEFQRAPLDEVGPSRLAAWIGVLAIAGGSACSIPNPAYGLDGGDSGGIVSVTNPGGDDTGGTSQTQGEGDTSAGNGSGNGSGSDSGVDGPEGSDTTDPCQIDDDVDGDGYVAAECGGNDCDDSDPDVHPGATEVCDDVDDDCDPSTIGIRDDDGDGVDSSECCNHPDDGPSICGMDCDDGASGFAVGDWAHCTGCGMSCEAEQACEAGACISARRVFVTSTTHTGNLGGYAGADSVCQARADEAGLGGVFRAMLTGPAPGIGRLEPAEVPHVRLDGVRVADNWTDVFTQELLAPFLLDENRQAIGGNAWTGFHVVGGSLSNNNCDGWTYEGGGCLGFVPCGGGGEPGQTDVNWLGYYVFDCDAQFRLYCLEQGS